MKKGILNKPNGLVVIKNVLTKNEHKLYNVLLKTALKDINEQISPKWIMSFKDAKKISGIAKNDRIKEALRGLAKTQIVITDTLLKPNQERWARIESPFIAGWGHDKDEERFVFSFDPILFELMQDKFVFAQISHKVISRLTNKHSLWLYEVMSDYKGIGKRTLTIEQIRILAGLREEQYTTTAELRRAVIDKAVNEIKAKTSFSLSYEINKQGRKIESFTFSVFDNNLDYIKEQKQFRNFIYDILLDGIEIRDLEIKVKSKNVNDKYLLYDVSRDKPFSKDEAIKIFDYLFKHIEKLTWRGKRGMEAFSVWGENQKGLFSE